MMSFKILWKTFYAKYEVNFELLQLILIQMTYIS